jgi:hypothetical protein
MESGKRDEAAFRPQGLPPETEDDQSQSQSQSQSQTKRRAVYRPPSSGRKPEPHPAVPLTRPRRSS